MKKTFEFNGHKSVSILEKKDYDAMENSFFPFEDDFQEILLLRKSDFIRAKQSNCQIFVKRFEFGDKVIEKLVIRIPKDKLFSNALKNY